MTQQMTIALGTCSAPVMALVPFLPLVLWILALRFDIPDTSPCNIQSHTVLPLPSPRTYPICTPQSHSYNTHILYSTHHARVDILCIHTFSSFILLYHSLIPRAISICAPFFIPVCADRFALIIFASLLPVLSLFPLHSCFCH
jgi:hypothetical protein